MTLPFIPKFKNPKLLEQAFIHRSVLNEQKKFRQSNERMEFLGDAVLELVTSEYLYLKFPLCPEGELTTYRSQIVQTPTLAQVAKNLNLDQYLNLSRGENRSGGSQNPSILADTLEALIGALYLDSGYILTKKFILKVLLIPFFKKLKQIVPKDYKSLFQEKVQADQQPSPIYQVIQESGPDHNKLFQVSVIVNHKIIATGQGKSKQKAEQNAAQNALEKRLKKV